MLYSIKAVIVAVKPESFYNDAFAPQIKSRLYLRMLKKRCPYCQHIITPDLLKDSGVDNAFLKREPFPCPNCKTQVKLPLNAEKMVSIGLLFSAIAAPLLYYWKQATVGSYLLFIIGIILIIIGTMKNQLQIDKLTTAENDEKE